MAVTDAGFLPDSVIGGETIWISAANTIQAATDITFTDYTPADGYTLAYQFAAPTPLTVAATANITDTGWTLEVTGANTLTWKPGEIQFSGFVTNTTTHRVFAVDAGTIRVTASPLRVSSWVAVLASIDAAIATYSSSPYGSVSMGGMNVSFRSMTDLLNLREYASYMLSMDSSRRQKRIIRVRFT